MAESQFEIPHKLEKCIAALSKLYAQDGHRNLQAILVNAQIRIHENEYRDGGIFHHNLHLTVPESIYLANHSQRAAVQKRLTQDLNKLHNVRDEWISDVFLEMDVKEDTDWRQESGLLLTSQREVTVSATRRIWSEGDFRLFLSHKNEVKVETKELKDRLKHYGVSAFVAHEDIHPTRAWQEEIENALATMDGFVALMTPDFHDSNWTDQEVGYALARGVPIIAVRLGRDPYGFLGKFQALRGDWKSAHEEIVKLLIGNDRMLSAYLSALRKCPTFDWGNTLSRILPSIQAMTEKQIADIVDAFNANSQLQGAYGFNGREFNKWGGGLMPHIERWGSTSYVMGENFPYNIDYIPF